MLTEVYISRWVALYEYPGKYNHSLDEIELLWPKEPESFFPMIPDVYDPPKDSLCSNCGKYIGTLRYSDHYIVECPECCRKNRIYFQIFLLVRSLTNYPDRLLTALHQAMLHQMLADADWFNQWVNYIKVPPDPAHMEQIKKKAGVVKEEKKANPLADILGGM